MTISYTTDPSIHRPSPQQSSKWRYLCGAMEIALSLGDYQKDANRIYTPDEFCAMALESINNIIHFDASAIYSVESDSSDLILSASSPIEKKRYIQDEMDFLINQGSIAWALREKRGICIFSEDGSRQLLLHVIATYARIRGLFIGIFPSQAGHRPDGANEFLSLMLRSMGTSLESIEYISLLNKKNDLLHQQVTEKVEILLRQERQLANTRKLNAVASLAGGIAHEFNNALTSLTGYNDLIKMDYKDAHKVYGYSEKSTPVLDRLASLTRQLLSYSRGGKHKTENIILKTLIDDCLCKLKNQLNDSIRVLVDFEDAEISIECDVKQMQEVLRAVITNAIEAISENGRIEITVKKAAAEVFAENGQADLSPGEYVSLEIRDNGCGMDQDTKDRMFEPFFSTKFTGRGLSMAAVYGILENHQGAIFVESTPGRETTVSIVLPLP